MVTASEEEDGELRFETSDTEGWTEAEDEHSRKRKTRSESPDDEVVESPGKVSVKSSVVSYPIVQEQLCDV